MDNPWIIFNFIVLDNIKLAMDKFYYFQKSSEKFKKIECLIYGYKNEKIIFEACNKSINNSDCIFEPIKEQNIKIETSLYKNGVIKYISYYPFEISKSVRCKASKDNLTWEYSNESEIIIASYPDIFSILPRGSNFLNLNSYNSNYNWKKNYVQKIEVSPSEILYLDCLVMANKFKNKINWFNNDLQIDSSKITRQTNIILNTGFHNVTLEIKSATRKEYSENYTCQVYFLNDDKKYNQTVTVFFKFPKPLLPIWAIAKIVLLLILLLIIPFTVYRRYQKKKNRKSHNAFELHQLPEDKSPLYSFIQDLPYDKSFEFPEKKLKLGKCLGYGNFGMVVEGVAKKIIKNEEKTFVAVKTVRDPNNIEALRCLISEMKIMIHLGKNLNVVNLLGAITKNLSKGELKVIVEYCPYGNLESFLKNHRNIFVNQIDPITDTIDPKIENDILNWNLTRMSFAGNLILTPENRISTEISTSPLPSINISETENNKLPTIKEIEQDKEVKDDNHSYRFKPYTEFNTTDLICWSYQITLGMDYISKRNIMHGDLAARNVLLAQDNIVKICDFGLAKSISSQYSSYIKRSEGQLPLKWLALESLQDFEFSIKSDVWSFGILLWELFSLGCTPYPGINARGLEFLKMLKKGYRMEKPEYANQEIYNIMLECWESQPSDRPKFSELQQILAKLLESDVYLHYENMNRPYANANEEYFSNREQNPNDYLIIVNASDNSEPTYVNNEQNLKQSSIKSNFYTATPTANQLQFYFERTKVLPLYENDVDNSKQEKPKKKR